MKDGYILVNIDETVISETTFKRKVWTTNQQGSTPKENRWKVSLKVTTSIDTEGRLLYSCTENNSNMLMFSCFLT